MASAPEQVAQPDPARAWLSWSSSLIILKAARAGQVISSVRRLSLFRRSNGLRHKIKSRFSVLMLR